MSQVVIGGKGAYRPVPVVSDEHSVDGLTIALMRCLCAFSAVLIFQFDPPQLPRIAAYVVLFVYCFYCTVSCIALHLARPLLPARAEPWVDVVFYTFLIVLTGGTGSIFYHYYFFAILVAAFTRGSLEGLAVMATCVSLYIVVGFVESLQFSAHFERHQALIRTLYLFLLGYMISQWGGRETSSRRRLEFLRKLSEVSVLNLRADHVLLENLRAVTEFFAARTTILVLERNEPKPPLLCRVDRVGPNCEVQTSEISREMARSLLDVPPTTSASVQTLRWWREREVRRVKTFTYAGARVKCSEAATKKWLAVATLLEARHLAAVPWVQSNGTSGRLYLVASSRLSDAEVNFIGQAVFQIATAVNSVSLQEELAHAATQQARSSISRDIHDTTIQSYIGLTLGLEAMYRSISPKAPLAGRIKELLDMATLTVDDLRGYVNRLQGRSDAKPVTPLAARLAEQVRRYRDFHGFDVQLNCAELPSFNEQMAADANGLVSEALSNVFRHTAAQRAVVDVQFDKGSLAIEVTNDSPGGAERAFVPRSIGERAASLGGKVQVRVNDEGRDSVKVTIPLGAEMLSADAPPTSAPPA